MSDWDPVLSSVLLPLSAIMAIVFGIRTMRRRKKNPAQGRDEADPAFDAIAASDIGQPGVHQQAALQPRIAGLEWVVPGSSKRGEHPEGGQV
jgi:hypothetical protein